MSYRAHKHLLVQIWQFKPRSDLEKLVKVTKTKSALSSCPHIICIQIWLNLPTSSSHTVHTSTFGLKFGSLSPALTMKIRSRSPKPNQPFIMSQCYIHANLVKIHPPVHEISCKESRRRQLHLHQKQYVPLPFGGGHKNFKLKYTCEIQKNTNIHCISFIQLL